MSDLASTPVQAIAVAPGSHIDTITAVALASAHAALSADLEQDPWRSWLAGAFTKTVRKIKRPAQHEKVRQDPSVVISFNVGEAIAYAYAPMTYEEFPEHLRKLQVSGLDLRGTSDLLPGIHDAQIPVLATPVVITQINSEVEMSTGKLAAQVAHALVAWVLIAPRANLEAWITDPRLALVSSSFAGLDLGRPGSITIRDNGLTEIASGTPTVHITRI